MSVNLGHAEMFGAAAEGQPGQRRFYLFARSWRGTALMWVEKEQLNRLSLTLDKVLAQLTEGQVLRTEAQAGVRPAPAGIPDNFPRYPEYDLRQSQMNLSYDQRDEMFSLTIVPVEIVLDANQEPEAFLHEEEAVSFLFTEKQAQDLSRTVNVLVMGGRPVCPLCHTPLDEGPHACEKQNGHHQIIQIMEDEEEEEE